MLPPKLLVALDASSSPLVFDQALVYAKATNSGMDLVTTIRPDWDLESPWVGLATLNDINLYSNVQHIHQETLHQKLQDMKAWLHGYQERSIATGVPAECHCVVGLPGPTICQLAHDWQVSLIVVGRRGYQGLKEAVLGSVSNYVVHHAPCSVWVVQGDGIAVESSGLATHGPDTQSLPPSWEASLPTSPQPSERSPTG